jgi:hypothetical protein
VLQSYTRQKLRAATAPKRLSGVAPRRAPDTRQHCEFAHPGMRHGHHGPCEHLVMKAANAGTPQTVSRPATTKAEFQGAAMASPFPCRVRARPTSVGPNLCRSFSNIAQCRCWPSIAERRQVLFCYTCGVQPRWRYPGKPPPHPQNSTVTLRSGTPVKNLFTWVLR